MTIKWRRSRERLGPLLQVLGVPDRVREVGHSPGLGLRTLLSPLPAWGPAGVMGPRTVSAALVVNIQEQL